MIKDIITYEKDLTEEEAQSLNSIAEAYMNDKDTYVHKNLVEKLFKTFEGNIHIYIMTDYSLTVALDEGGIQQVAVCENSHPDYTEKAFIDNVCVEEEQLNE